MSTEDFLSWYKENKESEDDFQISPKDTYEKMWDGRNFELSHLWQRSVFLAVFLLAIAGAYGSLIKDMYFPSEQNVIRIYEGNLEKATADKEDKKAIKTIEYKAVDITKEQQLIACGVCWIGIVFSILWIMMAKGSKLWYEKYELALKEYEDGESGNKLRDGNFFHYGDMPDWVECEENIFSTKAGHYSVSKVNTTIGIVSLIVFSFLEMLHFGMFLRITGCNPIQCSLFSISLWIGFGAVVFMLLRYLCKSWEA